eukprot:CAMPEP_0170574588 /NCGR_PEP_ID=MMETSP0224-20130122/3383_1 /TAXON_ID=285029 /ORGANISM="Togula jolla, Strain CCCM 725" /LENGTH=634 /DNA_ID=CAMNT_0010897261 /DNA_START=60 /DNA_END=1964 /DNA_ORIENTATION=+
MDCFYVSVERRRDPRLRGVPCAVVQYNSRQEGGAPDLPPDGKRWVQGGTGGIIAVSYEARRAGVTRQMSAHEARKQCPEVILVQVPTAFGKADLSIYKDAGDSVASLLAKRVTACEKRSVDEVAVDITAEAESLLRESSWEELLHRARSCSNLADSAKSRSAAAVSRDDTRRGHAGQQEEAKASEASEATDIWSDWGASWGTVERRLVAGAVVVSELRTAISSELGFSCSGGIATNKMLAKLGCGLHKPNQQTVVLPAAVAPLLHGLPLERLPGLGGDLGAQVRSVLAVATASELAAVPRSRLEAEFPKQAAYLLELAEGRYCEPVQDRELCKSLSSSKTFFGRLQLSQPSQVEHWLHELAAELHRRYKSQVERHGRAPTKISVSMGFGAGTADSNSVASRQMPISLGTEGTVEQIASTANMCFRRWMSSTGRERGLGVTSLGLSLSNMQALQASQPLSRFFGASPAETAQRPESCVAEEAPRSTSDAAEAVVPAKGSTSGIREALFAAKGSTSGTGEAPSPANLQKPSSSIAGSSEVLIDLETEAEETKASALAPPGAPAAGFQADSAVWNLTVDESVLAELPPDIQAEVRSQMGAQRAQHAQRAQCQAPPEKKRRGGDITSFFSRKQSAARA